MNRSPLPRSLTALLLAAALAAPALGAGLCSMGDQQRPACPRMAGGHCTMGGEMVMEQGGLDHRTMDCCTAPEPPTPLAPAVTSAPPQTSSASVPVASLACATGGGTLAATAAEGDRLPPHAALYTLFRSLLI